MYCIEATQHQLSCTCTHMMSNTLSVSSLFMYCVAEFGQVNLPSTLTPFRSSPRSLSSSQRYCTCVCRVLPSPSAQSCSRASPGSCPRSPSHIGSWRGAPPLCLESPVQTSAPPLVDRLVTLSPAQSPSPLPST